MPDFSPDGITYTVDVFRYDSKDRLFAPYRQNHGLQRSSFPYTVKDVEMGVYTARVDGNVAEGVRTFSICTVLDPAGEFSREVLS